MIVKPPYGELYLYPAGKHPVPAARRFFVFRCVSVFPFNRGSPEVGGGENFFDSYSYFPNVRELYKYTKTYNTSFRDTITFNTSMRRLKQHNLHNNTQTQHYRIYIFYVFVWCASYNMIYYNLIYYNII